VNAERRGGSPGKTAFGHPKAVFPDPFRKEVRRRSKIYRFFFGERSRSCFAKIVWFGWQIFRKKRKPFFFRKKKGFRNLSFLKMASFYLTVISIMAGALDVDAPELDPAAALLLTSSIVTINSLTIGSI